MSENTTKEDTGREILQHVRDLTTIKEDTRISKAENSAKEFISNANFDMLEAFRTGVHHKREFSCFGKPVFLRPLAKKETTQILSDLADEGYVTGSAIWEMEIATRTLSLASSKHPTSAKEPLFSRDTMDMLPWFMIEELSKEYSDYINCLRLPVDSLTEEQIKEYIFLFEKKPHLLKDLPYSHKEQIMTFTIKHYLTLIAQMDKLSTQS